MSEPWYSVKCLFHHPTRRREGEANLFEERITIWRAESFAEAHRLAEDEARIYATEASCVFVASTDSFHLFDKKLGSGAEVYSTMRGSNLTPEIYRDTFCVTDRDRFKPLDREAKSNKLQEPAT